jgi:hypothetical protein
MDLLEAQKVHQVDRRDRREVKKDPQDWKDPIRVLRANWKDLLEV